MLTPFDKAPWIVGFLMTVIVDPIWQGVNRIMRNSQEPIRILIGVFWILSLGLFGIGWIIDIISMLLFKTIKLFA